MREGLRTDTAHLEVIGSYQEPRASLNQEVRGDGRVVQVQLPLLSLGQPPALQLHGRAGCPAYDLPQDGLPKACTGQMLHQLFLCLHSLQYGTAAPPCEG